ncbi:unnamed protein product [Cuscuta epithymum]|uniref:Ubiquitin-like protease family profile domain-containing protein n=1 Tax=Cuscuta epithymum TaxID=186058 RepID=A0AAV0DVN9_9ASTE|nr:unnamed protein product [Cuscuta epithymum]
MDLVSEWNMLSNAHEEHESAEASEKNPPTKVVTEIPVLRKIPKRKALKSPKVSKALKQQKKVGVQKKRKASEEVLEVKQHTAADEDAVDGESFKQNEDPGQNTVQEKSDEQVHQDTVQEAEKYIEEYEHVEGVNEKENDDGTTADVNALEEVEQHTAAEKKQLLMQALIEEVGEQESGEKRRKSKTSKARKVEKSAMQVFSSKRITRSQTSEEGDNKEKEVAKTGNKSKVVAKRENKEKLKKKKEDDVEEDEDEETEKEGDDNLPKLWSRMSPRSLTEVITSLSEEQKEEVVDMGFGPILHLKIKQLPMQLAYWVVDRFDSRSVSLHLPKNEKLRVTEDAIHYTMGFPKGNLDVKRLIDTQGEKTAEMVADWRAQFSSDKGLVRTGELKDLLEKNKQAGGWFKKNFLVLLVTCLIEGKQNCFVNQSILKALDDESQIKNFNWCSYALQTLIESKDYWNKSRARQFPGPLLFLIVFYVDNMVFKGRKVDRGLPSIVGWTTQNLNKREKEEIESGGFGFGYIDEPNQGTLTIPNLIQNEENKKNEEECSEQADKDIMKEFASAAKHLADSIANFDEKFQEAAKVLPDDEKMKVLLGKVHGLFNTYSTEPQTTEKEIRMTPDDEFWTEEVLKAVEAIEKAQKKRNDRPTLIQYEKPSFTLLSQESNEHAGGQEDEEQRDEHVYAVAEHQEELDEQHNEAQVDNEEEVIINASEAIPVTELKEHDRIKASEKGKQACFEGEGQCGAHVEREKRQVMPGPALKSPYVIRITEMKAGTTTEEVKLAKFVFEENSDKSVVLYKDGNLIVSRKEMESLNIDSIVSPLLIDLWAMILNEFESLKSTQSRNRLIFTTTPCRVLEENQISAAATRNKRFIEATRIQFKRALPKVKNMDLFIFPAERNGSYYLMCFDMKYMKFLIIDNCDKEIAIGMKYLSQPTQLKSAVLKWLKEEKHQHADKVKNMKPEVVKMAWRNKKNKANDGVYLMRHMETFNGETDWDCGLEKEHEKHIQVLRLKYLHKMLTFQRNEVRMELMNKVKEM